MHIDQTQLIGNLNSKLEKYSSQEQFFYGDLQQSELHALYKIIDHVCLDKQSKEHIVYKYHAEKLTTEGVNDSSLHEVMQDYQKYRYIALEDIAIRCLQQDLVTTDQAQQILQQIYTKEVEKHTVSLSDL
ncbi:MAG: hypothetical protein ACM3MK_02015 [Chitinophagales bacterium]